MRTILFSLAFVLSFFCLAPNDSVRAQDFQRSFQVTPGGRITIGNVSGDINVVGYDGGEIVVTGYKQGRDREMVDVEVLNSADSLSLRVRYPENCNCNASIRFDVQVPRGANYRFDKLSTASGNIEVIGGSGSLYANTASGNVTIKDFAGAIQAGSASGNIRVMNASGAVSAGTASGDVEVEIVQLEGTDRMKFSSASGDVAVRLPRNLDAEVDMTTMSGSINTDFPLEVGQPRHGAGRWARGRLGAGSRGLRISSASGNLSLKSL